MLEFLSTYWLDGVILIAKIVGVIVAVLMAVAYMTLFERKVLSAMQLRVGPNVVGPFGLLQPFADGLKLLMKETIIPSGARTVLSLSWRLMITFTLALVAWAVILGRRSTGSGQHQCRYVCIYLLFHRLSVYGIIMAGWASNSKYAFLGGLRSAAQMVSYEVSLGLVIVTVLLCVRFAQPDRYCYGITGRGGCQYCCSRC